MENEEGLSPLELKNVYAKKAWEKLSHAEIREHLKETQNKLGQIICAGCGRSVEIEFTQLDHIVPKSAFGTNDITNRILLCYPCNRYKSNSLDVRMDCGKEIKKRSGGRTRVRQKPVHKRVHNYAEGCERRGEDSGIVFKHRPYWGCAYSLMQEKKMTL